MFTPPVTDGESTGKGRRPQSDSDSDGDEDGELDEQVWQFRKGQMSLAADLPFDGSLSGDEDGDF